MRAQSLKLGLVVVLALAVPRDAVAEGVGQVLTSKSIPAATVALIDPESGTSSGGSTTDVKVAVGDVILFQFNFSAVPDLRSSGLQGYLTEFVPSNTQVVGVRLIDENGLTIAPRLPGIAQDACATSCNANTFANLPCTAGAGCSGNQVTFQNGSIAQVYADTGVFYTTDTRMARTPANQFITLKNGIDMTALGREPTYAGDIDNLIGLANGEHYYGHAFWDYVQMLAYGWKNSAYSRNDGKANTPFLYGSPVAGPDTYYRYEATNSSLLTSTTARFNDVVGPWQRIAYPGSKIGSGSPASSTGALTRMGVDTALGWDLRPNAALPTNAVALRYALGEVRVGEVRAAEVALRVRGTPLDLTHNADVDCADVFGGDVSGANVGSRADDNPWAIYLPSPNCVYLNLQFDLTVNKPVADGSDVLVYTLHAKNLSTLTQNNVQIIARYAGSEFGFVGADNGGAVLASCPAGAGGSGNTCVGWPSITLPPSAERTYTFRLSVGGQGSGANVVFGNFSSASLPAPGFTTQALTIVKPVAVLQGRLAPDVASASAGGTVAFSGRFRNEGNQSAAMDSITFKLPSGWTLTGTPTLGAGKGTLSCSSGCGTSSPTYTFNSSGTVDPLPQCNDGVDNADAEDALADSLDPGCASALDNDEGPGTSTVVQPDLTFNFTANVPGGTPSGMYAVEVQTWHNQTGIGGDTETYFSRIDGDRPACSDGLDNDRDTLFDYPNDPGCASALDDDETATLSYVPDFGVVAVGVPRSARPVLSCPIGDNASSIAGTLAAGTPLNATVKLYFNGVLRASGTTAAQAFSIGGFVPQFGELYGGLEIRASATGQNQLESPLSEPCFVSVVPDCADGKDNDLDGDVDFPADPGCSSSADGSEVDPQCSDGVDNDNDGDIDWPEDLECSTPDDTTEGGLPACSDGVDNDGDALVDVLDPGCTSSTDRTEVQLGVCQDGIDNDSDGLVDYPADPGCHSINDDTEFDLTEGDIRSRLMLLFDTSGSMNWNTCDSTFTGGDGSLACPGSALSCATCNRVDCGNSTADDSRLFKAKQGVADVVAGFGDVEYALMRFHQRATPFACPTVNASGGSGGWQGAGAAPCGGGFAEGDLLVDFDAENQYDLLEYVDGSSNYPGTPPAGHDLELRGSGTTPLGGILGSALEELEIKREQDPAGDCRPYVVILLTDGDETCGGDPVGAAEALADLGYDVHVIGFATSDVNTQMQLQSIAAAGGTQEAIFVDNSADLAAAMSQIVADSILTEVCNGTDDDCDLLIDEGFNLYCDRVGGHPARNLCTDPGETVCNGIDDNCNGQVDEGLLNACGACGPAPAEICDGRDNNCNGAIDENGVCGSCPQEPEICDGQDNDCDGDIDEELTRACGSNIGVCTAGIETCTAANTWTGCTATGPNPLGETCNNLDDDCDGTVDGITRACGSSVGACQQGLELCTAGSWGDCVGDIVPTSELCNGIDDNCNGATDEGNPQGGGVCGSSIGQCRTGTLLCSGGALQCVNQTGPVAEACNGKDDDCDGRTDESVPTAGACGNSQGDCRPGVSTCIGGAYQCVGQVLGGPESCDGRDNDCDGTTDEMLSRSCGISTGECTVGTETCSAGAWVNCSGQGPVAEQCNTRDDDCDGVSDEAVPTNGACGGSVGVCSPGVLTCRAGAFTCVGERTGGAESCDNLDNDCDGTTDENLVQPCSTDVGECTVGTETCAAGAWINCTGVGPVDELCNDDDDDCDGLTDEQVPNNGPCGGSVGDCSPGALTCISGEFVCLGAQLGGPEACDNVDNDCDGSTDEMLSRPCGTDVGRCSVGVETCGAGSWVGCTAVTGIDELCNAEDDDCDGLSDEQVPNNGPCGGSVGDCSPGALTCVSGEFVCLGAQVGGPEDCDNADNDCDGNVDEMLSRACGTDVGECQVGVEVCDLGGWHGCTAVLGSDELCNTLDDDCDGLFDEGNPEGGGACGATEEGACEFGVEKCQSGNLVCIGEKTSKDELCNGLDDDCDTNIDEMNPEGGQACGDATGACQGGITECSDGVLICKNGVSSNPEVCNGVDDDCDGVIDDGFPVGGPCGSDIGACVPGIYSCQDSLLVCNDAILPVIETCNGIDDDCDDVIDDVGAGDECGSDQGLCKIGREQCIDGKTVCVGGVPAGREACDCDDNDCDGEVDEEPETGHLCPGGAACVECQCALPCSDSEFNACPTGKFAMEGDDGCFCVEEKCDDDECAAESITVDGETLCAPDSDAVGACVCRANACTHPCDGIQCGNGTVCHPVRGTCVENNCRGLGCKAGELCDIATFECAVDKCAEVDCEGGVCRDGVCERSCATMVCGKGERCTRGECIEDPCVRVRCGPGRVCDPEAGECVQDLCSSVACLPGEACEVGSGDCTADPCNVVVCPEGQSCNAGDCVLPVGTQVDGGVIGDGGVVVPPPDDPEGDQEERVLAAGGGGCGACAVGAPASPRDPWAVSSALLLIALVLQRLRRRQR